MAAPPGADGRVPAPGTTGAPKTKDGLPALQPPMGLNNKSLFENPIDDPNERMRRLENAVQELRNDFDTMSPSIVRLVAVEKDLQDLIKQLQSVVSDTPAPITEEELTAPVTASTPTPDPIPPPESAQGAPPPDEPETGTPETLPPVAPPPAKSVSAPLPPAASAPAQKAEDLLNAPLSDSGSGALKPLDSADGAPTPLSPTMTPAETDAPAPASDPALESFAKPPAQTAAQTAAAPQTAKAPAKTGASVTALRVGEHPGKTRLVFDIAGDKGAKIAYTLDLDNGEKILVIEIPAAAWSAPATRSFPGAPLIASYKTDSAAGGGTLLILQLKAPAKIIYEGYMPGTSGQGGRLIIDLARG